MRNNVTDMVERGRRIHEIQKNISQKVAVNLRALTEEKVLAIVEADNPHSKVFNLRRNIKKNSSVDFPLKDSNGVLQVSKTGINEVITSLTKSTFAGDIL